MQNRKPVDILNFVGGWVFLSITTALALSAIFKDENVMTPLGAWAVLVEFYSLLMHSVFGGLANLIPLDSFVITPEESNYLGAFIIVAIPFSFSHSRFSGIGMLFTICLAAIWLGIDSRPMYLPFGLNLTLTTFVGVFAIYSWLAWKEGMLWMFSKNLLGAGLLVIGLMTTGFFKIEEV